MRVLTWVAILAVLGGVISAYVVLVPLGYSARFGEQKTVEQRVAQYGEAARQRLAPHLEAQGVRYPPQRVVLVALKSERGMELWAANGDELRLIKTYRIHGLSGVAGPKLREGDRQVPEGVYGIESLNPNSRYHLSLRVGYPNEFDRRQAAEDGRTKLGGDIMIHGGSSSIGCLAMGDEAAEELFVLAADVGIGNVRVIICPHDLRIRPATDDPQTVEWAESLYAQIRRALTELR